MHSETSALVRRAVCALLALALHVPALVALQASSSNLRESIELAHMRSRSRPLIVTAIFFARGNGAADESFAAAIHERSLNSIRVPIPHVQLEAVAADSFDLSEPISDSRELEEARRLQGMYVGQIMSRLKRMLEETQAFPLPSSAQCVIHVIQDERGRVLEVQDDQCSAEASIRAHIASALRKASPLPTPPQGLAMGSYLTLDFIRLQQPEKATP
jgi:hypothetical protein